MEQPLKKRKMLKLYKALKIAYMRNKPKRQARLLKKYGYILDKDLSDPRETMVAYNPFDKKVLFVANGTDVKSEKDLITDFGLAIGGLKQSARFQDTENILSKARNKYKDSNFVLAGTSLGGSLVNALDTKPKDKVFTYNGAFLPNSKPKENVKNYRTQGDVISTFAPKQNTSILKVPPPLTQAQQQSDSVLYSTLKNATMVGAKAGLESLGVPVIPASIGASALINAVDTLVKKKDDLLRPHQLSNIENAPIFL
jgi:hypothetical protein